MVEDPSERVTNLTDYGFPASRPKITGKLSILIKYNQMKYSEQCEGTKIFSANKFKCFPVIHYGEYTMLTWRSLNQLQLLSDHLTLTRQPEKSHLYDKYGVPCSKVWLHFRSITQFDWCLTY